MAAKLPGGSPIPFAPGAGTPTGSPSPPSLAVLPSSPPMMKPAVMPGPTPISGPTLGGVGPTDQMPATKPLPGGPTMGPAPATKPMPLTPPGPTMTTQPVRGPGLGGSSSSRINPQQLEGFDQFADAAYQSATRRLDPRFAQAEDRFKQDMINRGLAEGTDAYNEAWQNFSMDRNDAYGQAQRNALAEALAAQGQAFGQDFQNRNLSQQARQFSDSLGYQYAGLNEQGRQFDANLGQRESEFGRQFGFNQSQADMQALMGLLGYGSQVNQQNNSYLNQDFNRAGGLFGMIPGMSPVQIDTMSPYQMQQQAAMNAAGLGNQASNGLWGSIGQLGSAYLLSDRRAKWDVQQVGSLDNGLPVYTFRYLGDDTVHLGLMAQEVAAVRPEAVEVGADGLLRVDYGRAAA